MVSPFIQPDFSAQTETALKTNYDNAAAVFKRAGAAFAPNAQSTPDMTVALLAGNIWNGVALTEKAAQNTATLVAPVSNPRTDRIEVNRLTGTLTVLTGVEAASPASPAYTRNAMPIGKIAMTVGMTEITNADITDERNLWSMGQGDIAHGIDHLIDVTDADPDDIMAILAGVTGGEGEQKITLANMLKVINNLIADGSPDTAADYVVTYDASASLVKKVLLEDIGGGARTLLATATASASATVEFTTLIDNTYDEYILSFHNVRPATDGTFLYMRVKVAGVTKSGASDYGYRKDAGGSNFQDTADNEIELWGNQASSALSAGNAVAEGGCGVIHFFNPAGTAQNKRFLFHCGWGDTINDIHYGIGAGQYKGATDAIDGIVFLFNTGNITSGEFRLYGVKKS